MLQGDKSATRGEVGTVQHGLRTLHDVQPQVQRIAPKDIAHVVATDDHHFVTGFVGDPLEPGRAHFAR